MAVPKTKQEQAIEIFNQLVRLDIGDVEEAVRLLFRVRPLDSGYPDMTTKVSRAEAALIAGYRSEAIDCLDSAWHLRSASPDIAVIARLQLLLVLSGQAVRAVELARDLLDEPGMVSESAIINFVSTALYAGDLPLLRHIAEREKKTGVSIAERVLGDIVSAGIDEILGEHQRIVRDVLHDYQMWALSRLNDTEEHNAILINTLYFDGTQTSRKLLERQVEQALNAHYSVKGLDDGDWRGKIGTIITEAPRHAGLDLVSGRAA